MLHRIDIMDFLYENIRWIFSGIGGTIIVFLIKLISKKYKFVIIKKSTENNDEKNEKIEEPDFEKTTIIYNPDRGNKRNKKREYDICSGNATILANSHRKKKNSSVLPTNHRYKKNSSVSFHEIENKPLKEEQQNETNFELRIHLLSGVKTYYIQNKSSAIIIGRSTSCHIRISGNPTVSNLHCTLIINKDTDAPKITVRDLNSSNGTLHNSNLIDGDYLTIGGINIEYVITEYSAMFQPPISSPKSHNKETVTKIGA